MTAATAEQVKEIEEKLAEEASKNGMTILEYLEKMKAEVAAKKKSEADTEMESVPQPIQPGPPTPAALAVAKFLQSQDLKVRTCILDEQRRDMFRGKAYFYFYSALYLIVFSEKSITGFTISRLRESAEKRHTIAKNH